MPVLTARSFVLLDRFISLRDISFTVKEVIIVFIADKTLTKSFEIAQEAISWRKNGKQGADK